MPEHPRQQRQLACCLGDGAESLWALSPGLRSWLWRVGSRSDPMRASLPTMRAPLIALPCATLDFFLTSKLPVRKQ